MVGHLLHCLSHEVVASIADAAVGVPVVARVLGADPADAVDLNVTTLAEAAALEEVFVDAACGSDKGVTALVDKIIDLINGAL